MNFVEEATLPQDVQPVQEDQPVNVGVQIEEIKDNCSNTITDDQADMSAQMHIEPPVDTIADEPSVNTPIADPVLKLKIRQGQEIHSSDIGRSRSDPDSGG